MTRSEAQAMIEALVRLREGATDAQASQFVELYPTLHADGKLVAAGTRINWGGAIKRATVDLWDTAENTPDTAPTLWEDIRYRDGSRIIPETITAGTAFALGELGWWGDTLYKSLLVANTYTPGVHPSGWEKVAT